MASRRASGSVNKMTLPKATGVTITKGELIKKNGTSNNVTEHTSGAALLGIATQDKASGDTTLEVDILSPGDAIYIDVSSGTPASGDFKSCDFASSLGAAVGTDANHDMLYRYDGSTSEVFAIPKKLEVATVVS